MLAGDLLEEIRADLAPVEETIRSARFVGGAPCGRAAGEGSRSRLRTGTVERLPGVPRHACIVGRAVVYERRLRAAEERMG
jgi:hypothetical protein